jgi:hypothetical protein
MPDCEPADFVDSVYKADGYFLIQVIFPVEIISTGCSLFFLESRRTSYVYSPGRIRQMLAVPPGGIAVVS